MTTVATKVRNALDILSMRGKKSWSEDGRGGSFGFMKQEKWSDHYQVMKDLGFDKVGENSLGTLWELKGQQIFFEKKQDFVWVHCQHLLMNKDWCKEQGI